MAKLVYSSTDPETIRVDKIKSGQARLLVRWDIERVETDDGVRWEYQEQEVKPWILPKPAYVTRDESGRQILTAAGTAYIAEIEAEILDYALTAAGVEVEEQA